MRNLVFLGALMCALVTADRLHAWPKPNDVSAWVVWPIAYDNKYAPNGSFLGQPIVIHDDDAHTWQQKQFAVCEGRRPGCLSEVVPVASHGTACLGYATFRAQQDGRTWDQGRAFYGSDMDAKTARNELDASVKRHIEREATAYRRHEGPRNKPVQLTFLRWVETPKCHASPI